MNSLRVEMNFTKYQVIFPSTKPDHWVLTCLYRSRSLDSVLWRREGVQYPVPCPIFLWEGVLDLEAECLGCTAEAWRVGSGEEGALQEKKRHLWVSDGRKFEWSKCILNKIINAPCGTLKLLLAKYIKSYKINFVVQYATDYCPLEHDNYKTISAHLGSPISCYINNLHGAFIFLLRCYY